MMDEEICDWKLFLRDIHPARTLFFLSDNSFDKRFPLFEAQYPFINGERNKQR